MNNLISKIPVGLLCVLKKVCKIPKLSRRLLPLCGINPNLGYFSAMGITSYVILKSIHNGSVRRLGTRLFNYIRPVRRQRLEEKTFVNCYQKFKKPITEATKKIDSQKKMPKLNSTKKQTRKISKLKVNRIVQRKLTKLKEKRIAKRKINKLKDIRSKVEKRKIIKRNKNDPHRTLKELTRRRRNGNKY